MSVHESHRERLAALAIAVSRAIPGGRRLLWLTLFADIPRGASIGRNVRWVDGARGVVVHPSASIGDRCVIHPGVILWLRDDQWQAPTLEADVTVGAGARVLGGVTLGRGCRVSANAVVVDDVPAGATAIGISARIRPPETAHDFRATV